MAGWGKEKGGFTLIEASIAIIIIGLLMVGFSAYWKVEQRKREKMLNDSSLNQVNAAIAKFKNKFGFYPCPAPPKAPIGNAARGREMRFTAPADKPLGATAIDGVVYGRCYMGPGSGAGPGTDAATGISRVAGWRVDGATRLIANLITTQSYPHRTDPATNPDTSVFIGAIPYVTLGLPEQYTYDAYGMKYTYAVSGSLTHNNTFDISQLNITTQSFDYDYTAAAQKSIIDGNFSHYYLLFSGGRDKLGSYTKAGTQFAPCTLGTPESSDSYSRMENCDGDSLFINTGISISASGVRRKGRSYNTASATHYFDDIVSATSSLGSVTWDGISNTTADVRNINLRNVGIGTAPNPILRLDVAGPIRANEIVANTICASSAVGGGTLSTPNKCLDTRVLSGKWDNPSVPKKGGFNCLSGYIQKIGSGPLSTPPSGVTVNYTCATPPLNISGIVTGVCDPGKWVVGFHADGSICCTGDPCP